MRAALSTPLIPAEAGIQHWVPAFAGTSGTCCKFFDKKRADLTLAGASGKSFAGARPCLFRFHRAVARGCASVQRSQQLARRLRHLIDGALERRGVRLRRLVEAGHLAHKLQRGGADFVLGCRWLEIEQRLYVAAHGICSFSANVATRIRGRYVPSQRREQCPGFCKITSLSSQARVPASAVPSLLLMRAKARRSSRSTSMATRPPRRPPTSARPAVRRTISNST